jgi:DNA-binding winged helix-turn-helix (wHTH) protein
MTYDAVSFGCFRLSMAERSLEAAGMPLKLSARALDILIVLVERAGEVVGKKDLMARVWPDVTVEEASLRFHIAALRKALGDGENGARYVITLPGRGYCFVSPVSQAPSDRNVPKGEMPARLERLPARLPRMIGREEVIECISERLQKDRFVSIVGPGGIGKTTVAIAIVHKLAELSERDAYFFDLGPCNPKTQLRR